MSGSLIRTLEGGPSGATGVALTPDGRCAVSAQGDRTLKVWDLETSREIRTLPGHGGDVTCLAVTPDGRRLLSASEDATLKLCDLTTGRETRTLEGHAGRVTGVAVTSDGRLAISTSEDTSLRVWNLESGHRLATLEPHGGRPVAWATPATPCWMAWPGRLPGRSLGRCDGSAERAPGPSSPTGSAPRAPRASTWHASCFIYTSAKSQDCPRPLA